MIPKSGNHFSDKIMLKQKNWNEIAFRRNVLSF